MLRFSCGRVEFLPLRAARVGVTPIAGIFKFYSILPFVMLCFPISSCFAGNGVASREHFVKDMLVPSSIYCFEMVKFIGAGSWHRLVAVTPNRKSVERDSLRLCWAVRWKGRIAVSALSNEDSMNRRQHIKGSDDQRG